MKPTSFLLCILLHVLAHLSLKEDGNNLDRIFSTMFILNLVIFNIFLPSVIVKEKSGFPPFHTYVLGLGSKEPTLFKNTK